MRHIIAHQGYQQTCQEHGLNVENIDLFIEKHLAAFTPNETPTILHMLGIPGAGKTTLVKQLARDNTAVVSFDDIMEELPEYRDDMAQHGADTAFERWEVCAREIGYEVLFRAIERKLNLIFDNSGSRSDHVTLLTELKNSGAYRVEIAAIHISEELALKRAAQRARFLPPEYIPIRHKAIEALLPAYKALADEYTDYYATETGFKSKTAA